jgi:lactate permease
MAAVMAVIPLWLTATFGGARALRRLWLPALAAGLAYGGALLWTTRHLGFHAAALAASVASLAAVGLVRYRPGPATRPAALARLAAPWWPYGVLMAVVFAWSTPALARGLGGLTVSLPFPALPGTSWRLELLASPGTAILGAVALVALLARTGLAALGTAVGLTARQLRLPVISMLSMFALAQVMNHGGMTRALGLTAARAGSAFPAVSPFVSWLGAAISGSNTASNALLGRLQATTAAQLGLDPLWLLALAGVAAPLGKMVAPQILAAAAAAGSLPGGEGRLLRVGLLQSLVWTAVLAAAATLLLPALS